MLRLIVFLSCFIASAVSNADEVRFDFSGKYSVEIEGLFSAAQIEFSIDQQQACAMTKYQGDEALGVPLLSCQLVQTPATYGPVSVPLMIVSFTEGSDEETHTYQFVLSKQKPTKLYQTVLVSALYTIHDKVNEFVSAKVLASSLLLWNEDSKSFEALAAIN